MKNQKTILFFPIEIGLAHIIRSLAIAQELADREYRVIFALPKRKHSLIKNQKIQTVDILGHADYDTSNFIGQFKSSSFVKPRIEEELKLFNTYKPDVVIVDFRLTAMISSAIARVPTLFLVGSGGLPRGCLIPSFGLPSFLHTLISPAIQQILWRVKSGYIRALLTVGRVYGLNLSLNEIIHRMHYLVPEFPGYLPASDQSLVIHYIGPLCWDGFESERPAWLSKINRNGKTVYLTFGGTGFDKEKMIAVSKGLIEQGFRVVVSSNNIANVDDFPKNPNLFVAKFLPGEEVCKKVDLLICHGGYGTMLEAVRSGIPIVAVPFNPDQILHVLRFAQYGLVKPLIRIGPRFVFNVLTIQWKQLERLGKSVRAEEIITAAREVLAKKLEYRKPLVDFKKLLPHENGSIKAATIIEQMMTS